MLLYFGGHTISANSMDPPKLNGTIRLHQDKESIDGKKNVEMFFLFVTLLPTCTGVVAVMCEKFDLPGWQILSCDDFFIFSSKMTREMY